MDRDVVVKALRDALAAATDEKVGSGEALGDFAVPAIDQALRLLEGPVTGWGPRVTGRCPACGAASLFVGSGGYVTCAVLGCKAGELYPLLERVQLQERARKEWGIAALVAHKMNDSDRMWKLNIPADWLAQPKYVQQETETATYAMALDIVRHFRNPAWRGGGEKGLCDSTRGERVDDLINVDCRLCWAEVQSFLDSQGFGEAKAP